MFAAELAGPAVEGKVGQGCWQQEKQHSKPAKTDDQTTVGDGMSKVILKLFINCIVRDMAWYDSVWYVMAAEEAAHQTCKSW